ncbi:uncharacterized protein LOC107476123 [Arachis duranensis]|uniref:Uncharacterized protein LOC107476123 n=1 Tax=Arachis duranensis TaxID=130453 RepID=A0A9C6TGY3_ARADU|nr:uncharacterized protein LOC107476123 [Arachis duranensis]
MHITFIPLFYQRKNRTSCLQLPGFFTSTPSTSFSLIPNSETQTLSSLTATRVSLRLTRVSTRSHSHTHRRLVAPLLSSPAFQRLAAFPGLLLAGDRSTRRIVVARRLLVSSTRRRESPWIVDRRRVVTCFVARPLMGSGPLRHPVALEKGVPAFWLNAMKNNEVLADEISEHDEGALKFFKDIKWSRIDNPKGFKLEFYFDTNPYFTNTILTKTYHMIDEDEPILEKAIG